MHRGDVAGAVAGGVEAAAGADAQDLDHEAVRGEASDDQVQADAVAADDDEIGRLDVAAEQGHLDELAGVDVLGVGGHLEEAVRLARTS